MSDLAALRAADFTPLCGTTFRVCSPGSASFDVQLSSVTRGLVGVARTQFSLLFIGGPTPPLAQGVQELSHPTLGELSLFLVPLGPTAAGQRYEAVFA